MYSIDIISTAWHLKNSFQNGECYFTEVFQIRLSENGNKNYLF